MRKILTSLAIGSALIMTAGLANAGSPKAFESNITSIPATSIRIEAALSEDLAYRANNLPKKISDRSSARGLNSGFAGNGLYGEKDLNRLVADLEKWTEQDLEKRGIDVDEEAQAVLKITLVDVRPNRPTFNQLSRQPGLSFQSFALGGAEFEGELFTAEGASLGQVSYSFYETFFDQFQRNTHAWYDARRSMRRFSKRLSKDLAKHRIETGT